MDNTKERPLILTAQEVNAVLAGNKTQHRVPFDFEFIKDVNVPIVQKVADETDCTLSELVTGAYNDSVYDFVCPFGKVGDRLWVQEEHRPIGWLLDDGEVMIEYRDGYSTSYNYLTEEELEINPNDDYPLTVIDELLARKIPINEATERFDFSNPDDLPHWRAADVMPQFASRLLLEVTDINIERVQDISEDDALSIGLSRLTKDGGRTHKYGLPDKDGLPGNDDYGWHWSEWHADHKVAFARYWDNIQGKGAWDRNDWVWVIEFKVVEPSEVTK